MSRGLAAQLDSAWAMCKSSKPATPTVMAAVGGHDNEEVNTDSHWSIVFFEGGGAGAAAIIVIVLLLLYILRKRILACCIRLAPAQPTMPRDHPHSPPPYHAAVASTPALEMSCLQPTPRVRSSRASGESRREEGGGVDPRYDSLSG